MMRSIKYFEQQGMKWNTEALFFTTLVIVLSYTDTDLAPMVNKMAMDVVGYGGDLRIFRPNTDLMRKTLTYLATRDEKNLTDKRDLFLFQRLIGDFDISEYIAFIKRLRNNSIDTTIASNYLSRLYRVLHINNSHLLSFARLVRKFPNLQSSQQIDALYKLRNYALRNYRNTAYASALSAMYDGYVEKYGTEERYTGKPDMSDLGSAAMLAAIAGGTYKMSKFLMGLRRKRPESWAKRIAGKGEHRGFDDTFGR